MTGTWASGWATGDVVTAAEFKKAAGSVFDTTLGGSAASIDITGISATYAHLMISIYARCDTAAVNTSMYLQFNGDAAANYDWQQLTGNAAVASAAETFTTGGALIGTCPAGTAGANLFGSAEVFIPHYAGSTNNKQLLTVTSSKIGTTTASMQASLFGGSWRSNAAINRVTLIASPGNYVAGSRLTIHALGA